MKVTLTPAEVLLAYQVAAMRQTQNMVRSTRAKHGAPEGPEGEILDVIACRGEMAVAKALNLYWAGTVGRYGAPDVGEIVDVRTRRQRWHDLILHREDPDERPFVLAFAESPQSVELLGWILGSDGKQERHWKDPAGGRPAYFVPQSELRPMGEIVERLARVTA